MVPIDLLWPLLATVIVAAALAVVCGTKKKKEDKNSKQPNATASIVASAAPARPVVPIAKSVEGKSRSGSGSTSAQFTERKLALAKAALGSPARDASPSPTEGAGPRDREVPVVARPPAAPEQLPSPEKARDADLPPPRRPVVAPKEPLVIPVDCERDRDRDRNRRDRDRNRRDREYGRDRDGARVARLYENGNEGRNRKMKNKMACESIVEVKRDSKDVYKGKEGEDMRAPCHDETLQMCDTGAAFGPADKAKETGESGKIPESGTDQSGPEPGSNPGSDAEPRDKREESYEERKEKEKERDRRNKKKSDHKKKGRAKDKRRKKSKKHRSTSTSDSEEDDRRRKRSDRDDENREDNERRKGDKRKSEEPSNPTPE